MAYGFRLPFCFVLLKLKPSKKRETGTSHLKVWLNHVLRNRAQNLVKDDFCWSSSARQCLVGHWPMCSIYRVARKFCGSLFLRIGDFLVFCGNYFFRSGHIDFSSWKLIFAIFRKYPVPSIDNMFVFY